MHLQRLNRKKRIYLCGNNGIRWTWITNESIMWKLVTHGLYWPRQCLNGIQINQKVRRIQYKQWQKQGQRDLGNQCAIKNQSRMHAQHREKASLVFEAAGPDSKQEGAHELYQIPTPHYIASLFSAYDVTPCMVWLATYYFFSVQVYEDLNYRKNIFKLQYRVWEWKCVHGHRSNSHTIVITVHKKWVVRQIITWYILPFCCDCTSRGNQS